MSSEKYTLRTSKILIETSVLLAASVRFSFPEEGELRDHFYYPCIELFSLIRKNLPHRLGITTQTVELEAYRTLSSAVMNTLQRDVPDKSKHFEYSSIAWNKCEENMRKLTNILLREPCDERECAELNNEVYQMYKGLEARALSEKEVINLAHRGIQAASSGMRKVLFDSHLALIKQNNAQLIRLKRHHASRSDAKILAEAIHVKRRYEKSLGLKHNMLLASTDSNNFVPAHTKFGLSRTITDEIFHRYGIDCDWPSEILKRFA